MLDNFFTVPKEVSNAFKSIYSSFKSLYVSVAKKQNTVKETELKELPVNESGSRIPKEKSVVWHNGHGYSKLYGGSASAARSMFQAESGGGMTYRASKNRDMGYCQKAGRKACGRGTAEEETFAERKAGTYAFDAAVDEAINHAGASGA